MSNDIQQQRADNIVRAVRFSKGSKDPVIDFKGGVIGKTTLVWEVGGYLSCDIEDGEYQIRKNEDGLYELYLMREGAELKLLAQVNDEQLAITMAEIHYGGGQVKKDCVFNTDIGSSDKGNRFRNIRKGEKRIGRKNSGIVTTKKEAKEKNNKSNTANK